MKNSSKIGLALGGGAVLGAAHVGVLRAMEELDIKINYITGTSIGAFIAAFVAFGKKWYEIEEIASELKWMDITGVTLSKYGLLSNEKLGNLIIKHIGDKNIEDAEIPLAMIATDIETGEKVILDKGSVADAAMASTCIPGIFKPVEINGKMLVDGGIVENVPINTVKNMGADFVIGVDLNAKHSYKKPDNIIDVLLNSFHIIMKHSVKYQTLDAELLIEPNLAEYNMAAMNQVDDIMKIGFIDAKKAFNERKTELKQE